jgi:intein-encoded DNA endonuclease-like protein
MDITLFIINEYTKGRAYTSIAKEIKKSPSFVKRVLVSNSIRIRNLSESHEIYFYDKSFFEKIDSEIKAYILGFLYADGNVCKNVMQIALHKQDEQFLFLMKKALNSSHLIVDDRGYRRFRIGNSSLVEQLNRLGIKERKTTTLTFPNENIVPLKLQRHFIRGFFDGDGCITFSVSPSNKIKWKFQITSNFSFLNSIRSIFCKELGFNLTSLRKESRTDSDVFYLEHSSTGSNKIKKIYDFLYKNSEFSLDRKRKKFEILINNLL